MRPLPRWRLRRRQFCDLEMLLTGGFAPLTTFLGRADYESVCERMRLAGGRLWPVPVTLDLPDDVRRAVERSGRLLLCSATDAPLAVLQVTEAWRPNREAEAHAVFGTGDSSHPGVAYLRHRTQPWYVTGSLHPVAEVRHRSFADLRHTPAQLRAEFRRRGWARVVAFQTRNPMHNAHVELTLRAARDAGANLLIHPVVGQGKPGDVPASIRVPCYRAILGTYPGGTAMLSLLPLAMRMAGPREALWHALIRANYGATHFIVGRDHAGPGTDRDGRPFYDPYDAQRLVAAHAAELGITVLPFRRMVYLADHDRYCPEDEVPPGARPLSLSGTELRTRLRRGAELPPWFTAPEVAAALRRAYTAAS